MRKAMWFDTRDQEINMTPKCKFVLMNGYAGIDRICGKLGKVKALEGTK